MYEQEQLGENAEEDVLAENSQEDHSRGIEVVPDVIKFLKNSPSDVNDNDLNNEDPSNKQTNVMSAERNYQKSEKKWKTTLIVNALAISFCIILSAILVGLFTKTGRLVLLIISGFIFILGLTIIFYGGAITKYMHGAIVLTTGFGILVLGIYEISQFNPQTMLEEFRRDEKSFMSRYKCSCWDDIETPDVCQNSTQISCLEMTATKGLIGFVTAATGFVICICSSLYFSTGQKISNYMNRKSETNIETPAMQGYKRYIDYVDDPKTYKSTSSQKDKKL